MRPSPRAFSLLELIFAIGIVILLAALVVPAAQTVMKSARRAECLNNLRNLGLAHVAYTTDNKGRFIDAGLAHGGLMNEELAWLNTLQDYYNDDLVVRSPLDDSPHWPLELEGDGVTVNGQLRRTSYGFNSYLSRTKSPNAYIPGSTVHDRLTRVINPAATTQFVVMAFESPTGFAVADHVHPEQWEQGGNPALAASFQMQIDAAGGKAQTAGALSNYGFVDGHVSTLAFAKLYVDQDNNRFDPERAKTFVTTVGLD